MTHSNDFIFYANSAAGVSKQKFQDFTTFVLETGILGGAHSIVEEHALKLASQLFVNRARVVATNLTVADTQMPFKQRGSIDEIMRYINSNYVYAPIVHPLLVGISTIAVVDIEKKILDVKGTIINTSVLNYAQPQQALIQPLVIENDKQNDEALVKLLDIMDKDPENIALIMPIRDAINQFESKVSPITEPIAIDEIKPKRKPRKKKE